MFVPGKMCGFNFKILISWMNKIIAQKQNNISKEKNCHFSSIWRVESSINDKVRKFTPKSLIYLYKLMLLCDLYDSSFTSYFLSFTLIDLINLKSIYFINDSTIIRSPTGWTLDAFDFDSMNVSIMLYRLVFMIGRQSSTQRWCITFIIRFILLFGYRNQMNNDWFNPNE